MNDRLLRLIAKAYMIKAYRARYRLNICRAVRNLILLLLIEKFKNAL